MAQEGCNLSDKRELDYLMSLKAKGIDGKRMLKDVGGFDEATGALRVGNIRIDKFDIEPEAKKLVEELVKEGNYFVEQRRGTISFKRTEELAMELQPQIKLKPGQTLNAEELQSLANAVAGLTMKATEAAQASAANNTEENIAKAQAARLEATIALASLSGAKSEVGRALSVQRNLIKALSSRDALLIRKAIKIGKGRFTDKQIIDMISKIDPDDIHAQYRFLQSLRKPKFGDYVMELWYNSILSGPLTHIRNLVGNTSHAVYELAIHPTAAIYDTMKSGLTGKPRTIHMSEMPGSLQAAFMSLPTGVRRGLHIMLKGYSLDEATMLELRKGENIKGKAGAIINLSSRMLRASDTIARSMFMSYDMYGQAYTTAKNEGLKGEAMKNRIADLIAHPNEDMLTVAQKYSSRNVFQGESQGFIKGISRLRSAINIKGFQPGVFVLPFVETPANIYKVGFQSTPLGFISKSESGRESAQNFARALTGSLAMTGLAVVAATGAISGSGPSDPDKKAALYRTGWQPDSIKIGGRWYSYKNISPLNIPLSLIGNIMDGYIHDGVVPDTQGLTTLMVSNAKSMFNQSFFSGINGLLGAVTGEDYQRAKFLNGLGTSIVPQVWQQSMRIYDPTLYQPVNLGDALKKSLGLTEGLPVKYDVFGQPIKGQRAGGLPLFPSQEKISPVEQKLITLGVQYLSPAPDKIGKRKMTPDEYAKFSEQVGLRLASQLEDDAMLPMDLNIIEAQDVVDKIRANVFKEVKTEMFPELTGSDSVLRYDDNTIQTPDGVLDTIMLNATAVGTDPVTAFQRMFTGQKIRYVMNKTIVVERMDLDKSEAVKQQLGGANSEMKLDHHVPLQLGGGNDRGNLKLVPTSVWETYTPVENHLGGLLRNGRIDKTKAQNLIKEFKDGKIEAEDILKLK